MLNMVYPTIYASNIPNMLGFYVNEIGVFNIGIDYGMENYLLLMNDEKSGGLNICPGENNLLKDKIVFSIFLSNIDILFDKIKKMNFSSGAELLTKNSIFEYPPGKSITMRDPGGNLFIIEQPQSIFTSNENSQSSDPINCNNTFKYDQLLSALAYQKNNQNVFNSIFYNLKFRKLAPTK